MGDPALATPVGVTLLLYVLGSYALAFKFSSKVESSEDYLVAGRSLSLPLASATLLATWFGAGTLLTAADEVRKDGLRAIALEPLGAAICLLITGFWFARPLWEMKLETLGDFFARRYGKRAELCQGSGKDPSQIPAAIRATPAAWNRWNVSPSRVIATITPKTGVR